VAVTITFQPLRRADFPLLARWLAEPLVARWWDHEFTPEALEADFGKWIDGRPSVFLVLLDGHRIGLIQRYRLDSEPEYVAELSTVCEVPAAALGIDYLIGEPSKRGRGLGAEIIAAFIEQSWPDHPDSNDVIVPVAAGNPASWRSLEKAGFTLLAEGHLKPDNPIDPPDHRIYRLPRPGVS
jgi:aminoglycoside 6'-N-acetyltransferase